MTFVFSADGHLVEPKELYAENLPADLAKYSIRSEREGEYIVSRAGSSVLNRTRINIQPYVDKNGDTFARANRLGATNIDVRLQELAGEGIDAEIVFPSSAMFTSLVDNAEAEAATARIYNDWHDGMLRDRPQQFVRCGVIPVRDLDMAMAEMKRMAQLGFTAAMLPSFMPRDLPNYNDPRWDAIYEAAQALGIVLVLHTGSGRADQDIREEKGPGGAIFNYTIQMCDAQKALMHLVGGGGLDRFPGAKVAVIESGASWLAGLAERMDEVAEAHDMFVRPKLSLKPSEIIRRQVHASFQYDRACIMSRSVTGHQALLWGADYPHHEGTFPRTREVLAHLFDGIEISEQEKADIIGGNAARLFRLPRPEFATAA